MNWKRVGVVVAVVVVIAAVGAYAVLAGIGPFSTGNGDANAGNYPTASPGNTYGSGGNGSGGGGSGSGGTAGNASSGGSGPPFAFGIDSITKCGQTCRKVKATLHNRQSTAAENVTVYSRIYAGNDTKSKNRVWAGKQPVGHLAAGGSYTGTQTVKLSFSQAYSVKQHGGWITVVTTVQTANRTVSFQSRRDVT